MSTKYGAVEGDDIEDGTVTKGFQLGSLNTDVILGDDNSMSKKLIFSGTARDKEAAKLEKIIAGAASSAPGPMVGLIKKAAPCIARVGVCCEACIPVYLRICGLVYKFYSKLPKEEATMILGFLLCFFGGAYPYTMAAAEAWRQCGGTQTAACLHDLAVQFENAKKASDEDDLKDEDGDGIADVEQITPTQLVQRKMLIVATSTDPDVMDRAFSGVYTGWAAIIAVLKLQFARTIALGSAIGDFLYKMAQVEGHNILVHFLEPDLHKWIDKIIAYVCKIIAITIACYIQKIISTFYSSIRGGLLISRTGLVYLHKKFEWFRKLFPNLDLEMTYMDEIGGWALAALGFYIQFQMGFNAPWIFQLVLWPIGLVEGTLMWAVNSK